MSESVVVLNEASFDGVVGKSDVPVLVDFWGEGCAPCVAMEPVMRDVALEQSGSLVVGKLNADENPALAERFGVRSVPTLIFFRDGQPVKRLFGVKRKRQIIEVLDEISG